MWSRDSHVYDERVIVNCILALFLHIRPSFLLTCAAMIKEMAQ